MLEVNRLHFSYGDIPILQDVSLQVLPRQLCALFGPNGSGKTTLFRCCLGFLRAQSGEIRISGQNIRRLSVSEMARMVAWVPQEHQAPFSYTVQEVVLMGRTPHLGSLTANRAHHRAQVAAALVALGIADLATTPYNQLSGGQRQLTLIARALAQDTPLLLLDEPTSSLDFKNQLLIWQILRRIAREGRTVLVCTHDPNHVLWFCDQAIVLHEHRLIAQGTPQEALSARTLDMLYGAVCRSVRVGDLDIVVPAAKIAF